MVILIFITGNGTLPLLKEEVCYWSTASMQQHFKTSPDILKEKRIINRPMNQISQKYITYLLTGLFY